MAPSSVKPRSPGRIALAVPEIDLLDALPRDDADAARPRGPRGAQLGDDVGPARRLIMKLRAVGVDVVELPGARVFANQLPSSAPDRRVAEMLPVERARLDGAASERREHAAALE